jgi:type IV pilus assembly protein PilB
MGLRKNLKRLTERKRLGEILVELNLLTPEQLQNALERSGKANVLLGRFLISEGLVSEENMAKALGSQFGLSCVDLPRQQVQAEALKLIPERIARKHNILPIKFSGNILTVAVHDPLSVVNLSSVQELSGLQVQVLVAAESHLKSAIDRWYEGTSGTKFIELIATNLQQSHQESRPQQAPAPVVTSLFEESSREKKYTIEALLNKLLEQALEKKASDIHIEPQQEQVRIRQRIDGILHEVQVITIAIYPSLISRLKIMGGMDIAEKRQPQDGHFQIKAGQREVDFRVSTLPTVAGEKAVIRILDKNAQKADLGEIGMNPDVLLGVNRLLTKPHGVILVTGPTGSGKTTTVYSMIRKINDLATNIVTIEDPVEFRIDDVNQVQVNQKAGILFSNTLRSVLRQDPDVIMIGEIRDRETAEIAIRASLTGHLVISTLHTNNSAGTLSRLVEMGIEPFLISSSLLGVLSQRLVRRLCRHCKEPYQITEEERGLLGAALLAEGAQVFRPKGCQRCNGIGFKGRVGIFELLVPDAAIRRLVSSGQVDEPIHTYLWEQRFHSMRMDGIDKVVEGVTSVEEVLKETL